MSTPKDHHYVPRSFFKPWSNQFKKLVVYERKNGIVLRPYMQSTKSICVQTGLYSYTATVEEQKRNLIEQKLFSLVDTNGASVLRKLQTIEGVVNLSDEDRYYFSVFINSLRIRTPEAFHHSAQSSEKILRANLSENDPELKEEEIQKELNGRTLLQWTEKNHRVILENLGYELMAKFVVDEKFINPIRQMQWVILKRNLLGTYLLTSDRPLVQIGSVKDSNSGLALAISPERIFIATSNPESIAKISNFSPKALIRDMNISTIQQAKNKAFAIDKHYSINFFENRLGKFHSILPWTSEKFS